MVDRLKSNFKVMRRISATKKKGLSAINAVKYNQEDGTKWKKKSNLNVMQ